MKEKLKGKKIVYAIVGIISFILIVAGITYAYWVITRSQTNDNTIMAACLDISLEGKNDISLMDQFPRKSSDYTFLEPYEFTIKNNCNNSVDYNISLEMLYDDNKESVLSTSIGLALDDKVTLLSDNTRVHTTVSGAHEARSLAKGTLEANGETSYELRLWIDENAPITEMNKTFRSKISVSAGQDLDVLIDTWDGTTATALADLDINEATKTANANSAADLAGIRNAIEDGNLGNYNITLNTSIDLNNEEWEPIGKTSDNYYYSASDYYFSGTFDGNGNTISNLNVTTDGDTAALIEAVAGEDVQVRDLTIEGGSVAYNGFAYYGYASGLIGYATDTDDTPTKLTVENVTVNVDIAASPYNSAASAAGIVGSAKNTGGIYIKNCTNLGNISGGGSQARDNRVAGIVGAAAKYDEEAKGELVIENCVNEGKIDNGYEVAGIFTFVWKQSKFTIKNCVNKGNVGETDARDAGGIMASVDSHTASSTLGEIIGGGEA